jgi:hypothetical protein
MANRKWIAEKQSTSGVEVRVWGRQGAHQRMEIERELGVTLGEEIASFVETIGNASIGPFMVVLAGSDDGAMSAITETRTCRETANAMPMHLVKVMDDEAGGSYFYNAKSDEVEVFESVPLNPDPLSQMRVFAGFDRFLEWTFEEAKLQSERNEFTF